VFDYKTCFSIVHISSLLNLTHLDKRDFLPTVAILVGVHFTEDPVSWDKFEAIVSMLPNLFRELHGA